MSTDQTVQATAESPESTTSVPPPVKRKRPRQSRKLFKQNVIAIIYDFDGTLTPKPMQEYTVLPLLNQQPDEFWRKVNSHAKETEADQIITYMRLLIEELENKQKHLSKQDLAELAHKIEYYHGAEEWFSRINEYVHNKSSGRIKIKHYLISAGLKEILEGITIKKHFDKIFASEYHFDHHSRATFPKVVINDTNKTQFLFRINKGKLSLRDSINTHMAESDRAIPFGNIIYIGDGETDVPCMTVTKKNRGHAIAVHKPHGHKATDTCRGLFKANRIDFFAAADFREGKELDHRVKLLLDLIMAKIAHASEVFTCRRAVGSSDAKEADSKQDRSSDSD